MSFSIRRLFRRGRARVAGEGDRRLAQRLVDRGIAEKKSGDATKALQYYRKAVEADDQYAPAYMNLGLALQAAGELGEALGCFQRAIAVDPGYACGHYNLALLHSLRSQYPEAEAEFRIALQIRADFPEAWVGLARVLEDIGRNEEALSALEKAIGLRRDNVGALLQSIPLLQKMGRLEAAVANSRQVLELEPENYALQCSLGMNLQTLGRLPEAESRYRLALTFNPAYAAAKAKLASVLRETGRIQEAIALLLDLVAEDPANAQLRRKLAGALDGFALNVAAKRERDLLLSLCADDNISMLFLNPSIVAWIKGNEGFQALQKSTQRGEDPFTSMAPAVAAFLREPLLLTALPRMPIVDVAVEEVLTHLRRSILLRSALAPGLEALDPNVPVEFVCALARQCFFSEYVLFADDNELGRVARMREGLQNIVQDPTTTPRTLESLLALASLYDSLHTLNGCEQLLDRPIDWSDAFRPIVQEQIANRRREREIAADLSAMTPIDDKISLAVRAQYEEHPYPRWVTLQSPDSETIEALASRLRPHHEVRQRPRPVPILIAGCGTGCVPLQFAKTYTDSEILAVDLSLASLAYAARMTEQFGIANITYRQADILKIGDLDQRFAIIECSGVLHHLNDPMTGWQALLNLLEPDGLMKVGLYSENARGAVRAAREFALSMGFPVTAEGIRRCRQAIIALPEGHPAREIIGYGDFFTLDGCRDLIMHVQEHQFTLPRIKECLDQLGLQVLAFECSTTTRNRFRAMFPDVNSDVTLAAWQRVEAAFPDTFLGMYSFWCGRK